MKMIEYIVRFYVHMYVIRAFCALFGWHNFYFTHILQVYFTDTGNNDAIVQMPVNMVE